MTHTFIVITEDQPVESILKKTPLQKSWDDEDLDDNGIKDSWEDDDEPEHV